MIATEIQELLAVEEDVLSQMLTASGWEELTEFTDEQGDTLLAMKTIHEEDEECSYLSAFLQTFGLDQGLEKSQINQIYLAINAIGGGLLDYREQFEFICSKVKAGADPNDVLAGINKSQQTVDDIAADYMQHLKDSGHFVEAADRALQALPQLVTERQIGVVSAGIEQFDKRIQQVLTDPESDYSKAMARVINGEVINEELGKLSLNPTIRVSLKPSSSSSINSTST